MLSTHFPLKRAEHLFPAHEDPLKEDIEKGINFSRNWLQ